MSSRDEGIVDVERRKDSVEYTLGDPTIFPPEFLAWLKRYIEQSGIQLPASSIFGTFQAGSGSVRNLAPGLILPFCGPAAPPGSVAADGSTLSRITYAKLFEIIGTLYGAPDADTFKIPDYRGRTLVGIGAALAAVTDNDGLAIGARDHKHRHSGSMSGSMSGGTDGAPDHTHSEIGPTSEILTLGTAGGSHILMTGTISHQTGAAGAHSHGVSVSGSVSGGVGPAGKPLDASAYHGILYVITTG